MLDLQSFMSNTLHWYKNILCNVKVKSAHPCQAGTGLLCRGFGKVVAAAGSIQQQFASECGFNPPWCWQKCGPKKPQIGLRSFKSFFSPKLISEVSFVANESCPPEFDAFHVLKARSHIFSLTFRHRRTSQMHRCVFVFPFSNRELCVQ